MRQEKCADICLKNADDMRIYWFQNLSTSVVHMQSEIYVKKFGYQSNWKNVEEDLKSLKIKELKKLEFF